MKDIFLWSSPHTFSYQLFPSSFKNPGNTTKSNGSKWTEKNVSTSKGTLQSVSWMNWSCILPFSLQWQMRGPASTQEIGFVVIAKPFSTCKTVQDSDYTSFQSIPLVECNGKKNVSNVSVLPLCHYNQTQSFTTACNVQCIILSALSLSVG